MKSTYHNLQIIFLFMFSLIPWPGPAVFKISCPRDNARIVRKIIEKKWQPVLDKYNVRLPIDCPFHPKRDIFEPQQAAKKQYRPSQWTCGICGKSFFEEKYLDMHFDNRHKRYINMAEDAVCLADYCDIMRCDVVSSLDAQEIRTTERINTDIEIWREVSSLSKAVTTSAPRDIIKYTTKSNTKFKEKIGTKSKKHCRRNEAPDERNNDDDKMQNNSNNVCQNDLVDAALPSTNRHQRYAELQKLKANCKPEELQKIKTKCEILIRDCIAGLLVHLSIKDFKEVEDELNRAVCWYLTCDRYWEDTQSDIRTFPWGLLCMIIMVLSLGICFCYYVVWVLFDTDDISSSSMTDRSTPSPAHFRRHDGPQSGPDGPTAHPSQQQIYNEDYYLASDKDNDYIYVTYPPDLKRRLLERYLSTTKI